MMFVDFVSFCRKCVMSSSLMFGVMVYIVESIVNVVMLISSGRCLFSWLLRGLVVSWFRLRLIMYVDIVVCVRVLVVLREVVSWGSCGR